MELLFALLLLAGLVFFLLAIFSKSVHRHRFEPAGLACWILVSLIQALFRL